MRKNDKKSKKIKLTSVKHVFKTIIWPRRNLLFIGLGLIIINRFAGLVLPGSVKFLIDDVIANSDKALLKIILFAVGGAIFLQAITSFLLTRLLSIEAHSLIAQLRLRVQKQIIRLPVGFFDSNKSGALVSRIMTDVEGVRNLVGTGLVQLFGGVLTAIASLFILLSINAKMTLYATIHLLLFGVVSMKAFAYMCLTCC